MTRPMPWPEAVTSASRERCEPSMIPAPIPANEKQRLAALRAYDILDTPPEEAFDRITELLALLLDTPVALVSFVDADRQWFKPAS